MMKDQTNLELFCLQRHAVIQFVALLQTTVVNHNLAVLKLAVLIADAHNTNQKELNGILEGLIGP